MTADRRYCRAFQTHAMKPATQEEKALVYTHSGMIKVVDSCTPHNILEVIEPQIAYLRMQLNPHVVCVRHGKVKWIRMVQVAVPEPYWQHGYRSEWGPVLQPFPAGA